MSRRPDGIIFDCDGVLVDVADSYGATIVWTVAHVLERLGINDAPPLTPRMIQAFKDTGAFNNEIDLSYVAILMMAASIRVSMTVDEISTAFASCGGVRDAECIASGLCDVSDLIEHMSYPGTESMVQEVFDQIFYGPRLYKKVAGRQSRFAEPGFIERERVLLDGAMLAWLARRFGSNVGMVTGRGYESARHTLGGALDAFNMAGSAFLEDGPRQLAKPNPVSLVSAIDAMDVRRCVYVGDSAEDLMMARAADRDVVFVGVWGTAADPPRRREMFVNRNADHVVEHIAELRCLLE